MIKLKKALHEKSTKLSILHNSWEKVNKELDELDKELNDHIVSREIIRSAAKMTQEELGKTLSETVTGALELVFDDVNLGFVVDFVTRRNSTECDMWITEDGHEYDPLESCGFGAADVASYALRIAVWALNKTSDTMVIDEPFRNLDADRMPQAAALLAVLSKELGIQTLVVTHKEELMEYADKAYMVTKTNRVSEVHAIKE